MNVVVTGGSGKAGRHVTAELSGHGHQVLNVDWARGDGDPGERVAADLTDYGQTREVIDGADAVVHLAAIPAPGIRSEAETFRINTVSTYNVFSAAVAAGVRRVVWASSETVLGLPFETPPLFAPIDESIEPRPESSYAMSKLVGEVIAEQFARMSGVAFVGLRISNIMEPDDYRAFPSYWDDPSIRKWNLWGYVDVRDVAQAVRASLDAEVRGSEVCIIAAADTVMPQPSAELMAAVYPDVPMRRPLEGNETLLAIDRARQLIGYEPEHGWRDHLQADGGDGDP
jgi:nucleoside-diphosphate-sugar epimerase